MLNVKNENVRNVTEIFPKTYLGVFVKPDVISIDYNVDLKKLLMVLKFQFRAA